MNNAAGTIYFQFYRILFPIFILLAWALRPWHRKISDGFLLRRQFPLGSFAPMQKPIWFHCASGEFEYIKPVIAEIKARRPSCKILVTYFSPSSHKSIQSHPQVDIAQPMPFDTPSNWKKFIAHHSPSCLLVARTDIWPEMLYQTRKANIPSLLFSATLVTYSGRMKKWLRPFYTFVFQQLTDIFCVEQDDQRNFSLLKRPDAKVHGDTRFDQVFARLSHPKPIKQELFQGLDKDSIFVAGSTWKEDEAHLIPGLAICKERGLDFKAVFAPHEPTKSHLEELKKSLEAHGLSYSLYSSSDLWQSDVLLIDQVGILAEIYLQAGVAFVGGSFKKTVHSVMEPLAAGCHTLLGPLHLNNREALEFAHLPVSSSLKAVRTFSDSHTLSECLTEWQFSPDKAAWHDDLVNEVRMKTGTSPKIADWITQHISE